jgi:hypothetical protein
LGPKDVGRKATCPALLRTAFPPTKVQKNAKCATRARRRAHPSVAAARRHNTLVVKTLHGPLPAAKKISAKKSLTFFVFKNHLF